ncbi:MAG: Hsp20/alpha crystallin family protein [Thermoanaerobaculaceae bacterium]|nr:Hsp20/alpha crystallin family protein [Thermoanaerobaculaceae bacterium]TAM53574.1 MAG: Hsp20/alpha crystallin family protein [Acidobacteriota bacterium]
MSTIVRWDPIREIATLQNRMNRVFNDVWGQTHRPEEDYISGSWMPAVDVRETKDALEIAAELPGLDPKDVDVSVDNGVLTLKGSRTFEKAVEGETYHRVERAYGSFERSFSLPTNVDPEKVRASYRHGVLHLTLPKREEAKPKSISIKVEDK